MARVNSVLRWELAAKKPPVKRSGVGSLPRASILGGQMPYDEIMKQKKAEYQKQWRLRNKERISLYNKAYYVDHKEYHANYYQTHTRSGQKVPCVTNSSRRDYNRAYGKLYRMARKKHIRENHNRYEKQLPLYSYLGIATYGDAFII